MAATLAPDHFQPLDGRPHLGLVARSKAELEAALRCHLDKILRQGRTNDVRIAGAAGEGNIVDLACGDRGQFQPGRIWPRQIAGREMDTYHRWMEVAIYATLGGLPALVVPAGFHANGRWPMGIQLIGPYGGDAKVLRAGAAYEQIRAEFIARRPAEMAPA